MIVIAESQPAHREAIYGILADISMELWELTLDELKAIDPLQDLDDPAAHYKRHGGIFKVILDDEDVVGMGGILRLDNSICELKRIFVRRDFRGKGLGKRLVMDLIDFGVSMGYCRAVLEVATPGVQTAAVRLYERLGFSEIPCYRSGPCTYAMEKVLIQEERF